MAFTEFPIATQVISLGSRLAGNGTVSDPINIPDEAIDNAALANVPTQTIKGRTLSGSGVPTDLSKAQAQAILSVDDLVALSGVADGEQNLGTFTGSTIPDSQTIKAALQAIETALEAISPSGGFTVVEFEKVSGVNANNKATVGYVVVSGSPTVDVVWTGEGGTTPTVTITVSGGVIRILDLFNAYENTNVSAATLEVIVNGVGATQLRAIPLFNKVYHNAEFSAVSPSANCYVDMDNTPQIRPYGYSASGVGTIKFQVPNIPAAERHSVNAMWKLS